MVFTFVWPKMPRRPDRFLILPPVMVPRIEVFFSAGVAGVPRAEPLSTVERSSKGMSPGGRKPDLYFSITIPESCTARLS